MSGRRESPELASLIGFLYRVPVGLVQASADGTISMMNPVAVQLLLPLAADATFGNLFDTLGPVIPGLREKARQVPVDGVICDAMRVTGPAGRSPVQVLEISIAKLGEHALMASVMDVSSAVRQEQERLEASVRDATRTDALTGLPNRAALARRIAEVGARGGSFALLFVNCDRFARVNESLGPASGDELLRLVARRLQSVLRSDDRVMRGDALTAGRLGSDEFAILLESLRQPGDAEAVAQRVVEQLGQPFVVDAHRIHLGASVGVVHAGRDGADPETLLQHGSLAMREAKAQGGGCHRVYEPNMKERAARRGAIEEGLRDALQNGGLFVAYQPIVSLAGGRCTGVEALVRWRQGARVVPPSEFIPVAEEVGLIGAVGEHVLREACAWFADVRARLGEAAPAYLSVNLSRAQLAQPEIVALVAQVLAASGVPGERLQLEVTETLAAQDAQANARLRELKALGVRIALDDFGTGFSSLACLHQLPVDVVKIDRSFVEEAETSEHRRVLVEATVRVAASLGMDTVVEGVETAAQARILRQLGCTSAQGYLFARPMPAGELERWLGGAPALLAVSA